MQTPPLNSSWLDDTLKALASDKRGLMQIALASGLSYFWLRKLRKGEIEDPGIKKVEKLFRSLVQQ